MFGTRAGSARECEHGHQAEQYETPAD